MNAWTELRSENQKTINTEMACGAIEAYTALYTSAIRPSVQEKEVHAAYEKYESENYKIVPDNKSECFTIYTKQGERIGAFAYGDIKIRQDAVSGCQFLISEHGSMSYDAMALDDELKADLQHIMGIETWKMEPLQGFTLKTHSGTGIQYLIRDGEEGRGGKVLLQNEEDVKKYEALAETYLNKYPNLIKDKNAAYIYADLEIKGLAQHTDNGFLTMGYDGISYHDNLDGKKSWSILFSEGFYRKIFEWLQSDKSAKADKESIAAWVNVIAECQNS
ncbi:MAG: hypothetical protein NC231_01185 [Bacillus sp. (in: Bacteria)]|nr:hypothetical protein [Bacillus sp. (in: firmicutes)]MCM1426405.1 hypothetical protein [Eubacterium sp.]